MQLRLAIILPDIQRTLVSTEQEIVEWCSKHRGHLFCVQAGDQRHLWVGILTRDGVVRVQKRHARTDNQFSFGQVRGQLAQVLDPERGNQGLTDIRQPNLLSSLASGRLEGGFF